MSPAAVIVIVVGSISAVACVAWFVFGRRHPEQAATHLDNPPSTAAEEMYDGVDRPAGPDAELMAPEDLGGDLDRPTST